MFKSHRIAATILMAFGLAACENKTTSTTPSAVGNRTTIAQATADDGVCSEQATLGCFSKPFAEPMVYRRNLNGEDKNPSAEGVRTDEKCLFDPVTKRNRCKPAAGTISLLPTGDFLYFNALEGTEDFEIGILTDFGQKAINDQTRVMRVNRNTNTAALWARPTEVGGGANPNGYPITELVPGLGLTNAPTNGADGALFCSDVAMLADGRILAVGGTAYFSEPYIAPLGFGLVELEGIKNSRAFNPNTNTWQQMADMNFGRWYPSLVTLEDSRIFVASGVTKLLKPVYPQAPEQSGRNVVETETFTPPTSPQDKGKWTVNSQAAQRALPLYPRLHLLPNGHVLYNAGGQAFNPFGQSYDQPLWNIAATYNPGTDAWSDLAYAGLPFRFSEAGLDSLSQVVNITAPEAALAAAMKTLSADTLMKTPGALMTAFQKLNVTDPAAAAQKVLGSGMRGSTSSTMLPLTPDSDGKYRTARFLTAGGVLAAVAAGSPGSYVAVASSRIDTVKTELADTPKNAKVVSYDSEIVGSLSEARWYGTNVLLPDDSVMIFSGGDRDGVAAPGVEFPRKRAERFDLNTKRWTPMATANNARTYHNTAILMQDGRVLVGGHAPISTLYLRNINLAAFGFGPNDGRDPSFEIYTPPYVGRADRPVIAGFTQPAQMDPATGKPLVRSIVLGDNVSLNMAGSVADQVDSVAIVRHTVMTHLIDGDQRSVVIPKSAIRVTGNTLSFDLPNQKAVLPQGAYMAFVRTKDAKGNLLPSEGLSFMIKHR